MKKSKGANVFAKAISAAANAVATRVIKRFKDCGTHGREEQISSQLAGELTDHLIEEVKRELQKIDHPGIKFDAFEYKKRTENKIGADLAGSIIFENGASKKAKVFLVQAKVAKTAKRNGLHNLVITASDERLLQQCKDMIAITPAAFVFVYSKYGVHVIPAAAVVMAGRNSINTKNDYYVDLGGFYEEVYKCFIGDLNLGDQYRDETKMKDLCEKLKAQRVLAIKICHDQR